ncbi:MAG: hypothetical protein ACE37K_03740 [Planctomycetota bacterium]
MDDVSQDALLDDGGGSWGDGWQGDADAMAPPCLEEGPPFYTRLAPAGRSSPRRAIHVFAALGLGLLLMAGFGACQAASPSIAASQEGDAPSQQGGVGDASESDEEGQGGEKPDESSGSATPASADVASRIWWIMVVGGGAVGLLLLLQALALHRMHGLQAQLAAVQKGVEAIRRRPAPGPLASGYGTTAGHIESMDP